MSQQQPERPQGQQPQADPIKYGEVFPQVTGELARETVAPRDAAMMQTAENLVIGQTQKGGPAAVMQSVATYNERAGFVGHGDISRVPAEQGVSVTETDTTGRRIVTESVGGQVVGEYFTPAPVGTTTPAGTLTSGALTIGEALEAAALTAGEKPVAKSDAAAIQVAEMRATGLRETQPGGVAAEAQAAADLNAWTPWESEETSLGEVVSDATARLPRDKAVTREDAEGVAAAEMRNSPSMGTHPSGVSASVAAAARLNQSRQA
ncbi:hypothetical protein Taro_051068 [Colocasia esculenta]|uniref:SMP domain-containing protein n=1 Tax=Colocasia esculenta TaxID=4460 RepID=A0A843XFP4_COLES|nr:hypothetical protein [Colocasia esculenta]